MDYTQITRYGYGLYTRYQDMDMDCIPMITRHGHGLYLDNKIWIWIVYLDIKIWIWIVYLDNKIWIWIVYQISRYGYGLYT